MADEMVEVALARSNAEAQMIVDEVLSPAGIPATIHNRSSTMIPAPATLQGGFYVAVPRAAASDAADVLAEAQDNGAIPDEVIVAEIPD